MYIHLLKLTYIEITPKQLLQREDEMEGKAPLELCLFTMRGDEVALSGSFSGYTTL